VIKEMLAECPEKLNFTHFLTLFGEKLHGMYILYCSRADGSWTSVTPAHPGAAVVVVAMTP